MTRIAIIIVVASTLVACAARTAVAPNGQTYTCVPNTRPVHAQFPGEPLVVVEKTPAAATASK